MLTPKDEEFLQELQKKRELVAARLAKLDPSTKEYAWEKEQLDDLDKGIRVLRAKDGGFIHLTPLLKRRGFLTKTCKPASRVSLFLEIKLTLNMLAANFA